MTKEGQFANLSLHQNNTISFKLQIDWDESARIDSKREKILASIKENSNIVSIDFPDDEREEESTLLCLGIEKLFNNILQSKYGADYCFCIECPKLKRAKNGNKLIAS